jgi:hypothetical protein
MDKGCRLPFNDDLGRIWVMIADEPKDMRELTNVEHDS